MQEASYTDAILCTARLTGLENKKEAHWGALLLGAASYLGTPKPAVLRSKW
jgi:hypothetical protein